MKTTSYSANSVSLLRLVHYKVVAVNELNLFDWLHNAFKGQSLVSSFVQNKHIQLFYNSLVSHVQSVVSKLIRKCCYRTHNLYPGICLFYSWVGEITCCQVNFIVTYKDKTYLW